MYSNLFLGFLLFIFGVGLGFFSSEYINYSKTAPSEGASMSHDHAMFEVDESKPVPSIVVEAFEDTKSGYNLKLTTTNFTFTPDAVGQEAAGNEGHAHVYVNGIKIARLYDKWLHIPDEAFRIGENTIKVTLNANDHSEFTVDGEHISDSIVITK